MSPIPVGIFENDDAIIFASLLVRIIIGFSHPQPAPIINAETNRLLDVRFSGKKGDVEPLGHLHRLRGLQWSERFLDNRLRVPFRGVKVKRDQQQE